MARTLPEKEGAFAEGEVCWFDESPPSSGQTQEEAVEEGVGLHTREIQYYSPINQQLHSPGPPLAGGGGGGGAPPVSTGGGGGAGAPTGGGTKGGGAPIPIGGGAGGGGAGGPPAGKRRE